MHNNVCLIQWVTNPENMRVLTIFLFKYLQCVLTLYKVVLKPLTQISFVYSICILYKKYVAIIHMPHNATFFVAQM